ncbi:MAG: ABC transporter ATP-binding protein [Ignavibacteriae bacterium]|nr:ABC transporter ATP-binding protein [Ignavibacteriota bacterium]
MQKELLKVEDLCFSYSKDSFALNKININVLNNDFISVIGRNGSGKSTLVKLISGIYSQYTGKIYLQGKDIVSYTKKDISKILSYLPQSSLNGSNGLNVFDFLLLGRYAYKRFSDFTFSDCDRKAVNESIEVTGIKSFTNKSVNELSGGEKQKVLVTLSLVQLDINSDLSEKILIIDEPLTFLDINFQYEIFSILKKLNEEKKLTIVLVTHNIDLALKYTEKTLLLDRGEMVLYDETKKVITEELIEKYFEVKSKIVNFENDYHILTNN